MIFETAPAKINLTLDTLFKRDDGYHEVEMIMTTVDLNDRLSFEKRNDQKIVLKVDKNFIPNDRKNLAFKAAELMIKTYELKQGVTITLDKSIPVAAGLAGGSSDAAATMRGINRLFELDVPKSELAALSASLGSDIPFCVYSETAVCRGRGEKLELINRPPSSWVIIAKPAISLSTADIYKALNLDHPYTVHTKMCYDAIKEDDYDKMCKSLTNRLEEVSIGLCPEIKKIKENMINNGADGALMSGSGPTVFGLAQRERQARHVYNAVSGCCSEVYIVRMLG
ncbi:4-(cytidine 5'-diphospho)-2-C-methyl-D-erythritol kinase [Staphylococcus massiliensis]|uniref:Putative 4-diphosphocytidyl-2-C-methyl-D-erythritol kinase n=1 Tax=Staphylococcus massiliensis S46 TaxID=1229783 RepID=K9AJ69_9STAP|nr:4-(cytidine 5'-diphospho)-2-C-methyl-D-erythritol kinase [Staphylococcus massiliensis]EKU46151.1 4-diphosphocytidyl-2-C-methyl-D-erythritol kinase [Staphylococcus massiliensis S46]MCG3400532.1 4-(cytidine 5'-diphospho)-2-C-methyl-D-erythritol kinase [Staphylococcus massiliensis]MCG3402810.1 4-(cytidine 5'-diphospho)-2-C-methyl-D-erythritol kinase [Staphylococcus massiliensis]MCG3413207.1 4-(cytidine 5'-diphospho)-2-C-methyl-D-erythritol kinase [Staphylococcus massiliensis]POA01958.1 4-(cyti